MIKGVLFVIEIVESLLHQCSDCYLVSGNGIIERTYMRIIILEEVKPIMEKVRLLNGVLISVVAFDDKTNKVYPYYQNGGSRFAYCPYCCSIVNIKGGRENRNQSTQKKMYASHHTNEVSGFQLNDYRECPFYQGNQGNWQGVYQVNDGVVENEELRTYIEDHQVMIADELSDLTGIAFTNQEGVNSLFESIHQSFINNRGLCRAQWHPDMVARIMLINSAPVGFWGYKVISDSVINIIRQNNVFGTGLKENSQFKSDEEITFVATMDDNENPQRISIKLISGNNQEMVLKGISAKIY